MKHPDPTHLSPADSALLDRLLAGEPLASLVDADTPGRAQRVSRLLSMLDQWEADDAEPGLAQRTLAGVLGSAPVGLSPADGQALDALLELRQQGLEDGPMPAGVRERVAAMRRVTRILDHAADARDESVPADLTNRTMQAIEQDRLAERRRSALSSMDIASHRQSGVGLRQLAATAALLLMAVSILLPMLSNARQQAEIAQCGQNLAGLGSDLQQIAFDYKGATHRPAQTSGSPASGFNPLAKFAQSNLDGTTLPASRASYFVLIDENRVSSAHLACPSMPNDPAAFYNGQNPAAGGPFRLFLQPRPIFADANPLYQAQAKGLVRNANVSSLSRSANHNGRGQNVLISDGSVHWLIRPTIQNGDGTSDNIWLFQPDNQADGQDADVFLTP